LNLRSDGDNSNKEEDDVDQKEEVGEEVLSDLACLDSV
jgi:hypothetical protein